MIPALFGLLAVLGSACAYERYFSIGHGQFIRTRLDPIVAPGKVSSHVHTVAGTSNFLATESFADARDGECTTSFIQDDKSSYWAPQLYYKWKNGTYSAIPGDGLVTYWKYASDTDTPEFAVVPDDFRMLAGDVTRDHFDPNEPSHQAISFECIGDGYDYKLPYIPNDIECKWIRPQAFFPNCWNGKDSYLPDNSHVIYPTGNFESGACPAGFVRIPSLFMEAYYKVPENMGSEYEWYPGCLVLANGDNHGYSFHSDWLNGWPSGMLVDAYKTCIDQLQGSVDGCSVFEASRDEDKAWHCQPKGEVVAEAVGVSAPLAQLPGNNPEFNSSRDSPDYPKRLFADYTESAHIIPVNSKGAGTCTHFKCADYPADPADEAFQLISNAARLLAPYCFLSTTISSDSFDQSGMDTSTLSFTDASHPHQPERANAHTSSLAREVPQPAAAEWFTRLISPLTDRHPKEASSMSTPVAGKQYQDQFPNTAPQVPTTPRAGHDSHGFSTMLLIFIPIMVVILTVLIGLVIFLVAVLYMRRRKGIQLTEDGGPLDLSKGDGVIGEGGVEGVESRWLENSEPDVREAYRRAKDWQHSYPPTSVPTDITLSQFLSIQEKGVSAWAFEPDYEDNLSLYVEQRTEITFLADGPGMAAREGGGNSVMANLPLPKLNEVYYWECKMYEKPANTEVAIGLATKPYPSFRLPGWNKYSIAYFATDGFKSHNYPFTASSYGPPLAEGDVLGVGYRPRTGTVFFTRNGRKLEDAYTGLQRLNLFPTVGANGPCTVHVNLGQAGFVFIEANVKKWGLAPMVGTLAPPPAYGSERGSILLDAGYGTPGANQQSLTGMTALLEAARNRSSQHLGTSSGSSPAPVLPQSPDRSSNSSHRHRRAGRTANLAGSVPAVPSPLRASEAGPGPSSSRRRALARGGDESGLYVSPTDTPMVTPRIPSPDALDHVQHEDEDSAHAGSDFDSASSNGDESTMEPNPPTPNLLDISLHSLRPGRMHYFGNRVPDHGDDGEDGEGEGDGSGSAESDDTARPARPVMASTGQRISPPPPGYAPLDPNVYSAGLPSDLPEDLINQAIAAMSEGPTTAPQTQPEPEVAAAPRSRLNGWNPFARSSNNGGSDGQV